MPAKTAQPETQKIPKLRFAGFSGAWEEKKLEDLCIGGFSNGVFNDPSKVGSGYRLINVKDMYSGSKIDVENLTRVELTKSEFEKNKALIGDIFFTRSSLVKEGIAYSNILLDKADDITFDGHVVRMQPDRKLIYPNFLAGLLKIHSVRRQFVARGKTATMTTIGQNDIGSVQVSFPLLEEQKKIADFLGVADEWIENLRAQKENFESYKKGMMQKIFSQQIRFKDKKGKDFPVWEEKKLGEVGDIVGGGTPDTSKQEFWSGSVPWVSSSDLEDGSIYKINIHRFITKNAIKNSATHKIPAKSILIVSRVGVGKIAITDADVCTSQDFQSVTPFKGKADSVFLAYYLSIKIKELLQYNQGTSIKGFTKKELQNHCFFMPFLPEQQKMADFLTSVDKVIESKQHQITQAETWKKGLMQGLFV